MKIVSSAATAVAILALCVSTATAAPARTGSTQSFCGTAQSVARYLKSTLTLSSSGIVASTPANLKLAYTTVVKAEPALMAAAPKTLKSSLAAAFSFVNLVKSDLEKTGWHVAKLTPYFPALVAKGRADERQITAVRTYLRGICHVPV